MSDSLYLCPPPIIGGDFQTPACTLYTADKQKVSVFSKCLLHRQSLVTLAFAFNTELNVVQCIY